MYLQSRNRPIDMEKKLIVTKGETWETGINHLLGMNTHAAVRQIPNEELPHSAGNSTQYSAITCKRLESKRNEYMYMCN